MTTTDTQPGELVAGPTRCRSCPWPHGTPCGGAAGVCEGNATLDGRDTPVDRAARWAHELADIDAELDRLDVPGKLGEPTRDRVLRALLAARDSASDTITPDLLAQGIAQVAAHPLQQPNDTQQRLAAKLYGWLAGELGWPA